VRKNSPSPSKAKGELSHHGRIRVSGGGGENSFLTWAVHREKNSMEEKDLKTGGPE